MRRRAILALCALGALLAVALGSTGVLRPLELVTLDARFSVRGSQPQRLRNVLVVAIDQRTDDRVGTDRQFPIPRRIYPEVVRRVRADGARAVVIDVQFTTKTTASEDDALITGLRRSPGTILTTADTNASGATNVLGGAGTQRYAHVRVASADFPLDPGGTYRRFNFSESGLRTLPVVVAHAVDPAFTTASLGRAPVWIDFAGGPDVVPSVSMLALLHGQVPASAIRGRIVLIGVTDPSALDLHSYSALDSARMAGVQIEANAIATALSGAPLRNAAGWVAILLALAFVLATPVAVIGRRVWVGGAIVAGTIAAYAILAQLLFDDGVIIPVATPLLSVALVGIGSVATSFVLALTAGSEQVREARRHAIDAADSARDRIERDLHDGVQQRLVALRMHVSAPSAATDPEILHSTAEQLRTALDELRGLARGAYPAVLREAGLAGALQSLADHSRIPVSISAAGVDPLPDDTKRTAYFVAAEGLANALKHAQASHASIAAARSGGRLTLVVTDNGSGGADPNGHGLSGLAQRAAAAGGTLTVADGPSGGTRLTLEIPL